MKHVFHPREFGRLAFKHSCNGNARPARHNIRDVVFLYLFIENPPGTLKFFQLFGSGFQIFLECRNSAVTNLGRPRQISPSLRPFRLKPRLLKLFLDIFNFRQNFFLVLPSKLQVLGLLLQIRYFFLNILDPTLGFFGGLRLFFQRLFFYFQTHNFTPCFFKNGRHILQGNLQRGSSFVYQIHRLVRQKTIRNISA